MPKINGRAQGGLVIIAHVTTTRCPGCRRTRRKNMALKTSSKAPTPSRIGDNHECCHSGSAHPVLGKKEELVLQHFRATQGVIRPPRPSTRS